MRRGSSTPGVMRIIMQVFTFNRDRIVFEGQNCILYDVWPDLPRHPRYPFATTVVKPDGTPAIPATWRYSHRDQVLRKLFVHQTAGGYTPGYAGCYRTAAFITRDPSYKPDGAWRGDGRGWPAMCYSYYIPFAPERSPHGKPIIFQCVPIEVESWHTAGHNHEAVAVGLQGYFRSRHIRNFRPHPGYDGEPSEIQLAVLEAFWEEYAKPTLELTDADVYGHFEAKRPKLTCPGNTLEHWILSKREAQLLPAAPFTPPQLIPESKQIPLSTWHMRQAALVYLGFDLGEYGPLRNGVDGYPGYRTRAAIEGFEQLVGLSADGVWDDRLGFLVQLALAAAGATKLDLVRLL
jgi:peptidoglycan hydrolase-like protein with peptidoglycan-binding domain